MRLRSFEPGDQPGFRDVVLAGLAERWGDAYDPSYNDDLNDIAAADLHARWSGLCLIARVYAA